MIKNPLFKYSYYSADCVDIGRKRVSNQDQVICCPALGFFAVSDGMGGLPGGGETSALLAKSLPAFAQEAFEELKKNATSEHAVTLLDDYIRTISDSIYETMNIGEITFGATLCGVWLVGEHAVFFNLGDSRGYRLGRYKRRIRQITTDHNVVSMLVANGEINLDEARVHPSRNLLTRFVGMKSPSLPELFVEKINCGDGILLCSDGLYGMVNDTLLTRILRSSKSLNRVVRCLIEEANAAGGRDNISGVYIKMIS